MCGPTVRAGPSWGMTWTATSSPWCARRCVLDVDRGHDVDAGVEQFVDVLPALGVAAAGDVGVGVLVDERDVGRAGEDGVEIHLGEGGTAVLDRASRDRLEVTDLLRGGLAVVRLEEPDDDVPEFTTRHWWEALLHNQSAWLLKAELAKRPNTVTISVPLRPLDAPADADVAEQTPRTRVAAGDATRGEGPRPG